MSTREASCGRMIDQLESAMASLNAARADAAAIEMALPSMPTSERLDAGRRLVGLRAQIASNAARLKPASR